MDTGVLKVNSYFCQQRLYIFGLPPQCLREDTHGDAVRDFEQVMHLHSPEHLLALALRPMARWDREPGLGDFNEAGLLK